MSGEPHLPDPSGPAAPVRTARGIADRAAVSENTSRGLIVLTILFLLLIGIIVAFSRTFITTVAGADPTASTAALVVAVVLPLLLMGVTIFQFVRLFRQRALRMPGAGLRLRLLLFFLLLLIVRGLPSLLVYRRVLKARQRVEMTFITATTLPLLIALVEIGQRDGVMLPATAAALVGAGVLSVLVYPQIAVALHRSALTPADAGLTTAPPPAGTGTENPAQHGQDGQGS